MLPQQLTKRALDDRGMCLTASTSSPLQTTSPSAHALRCILLALTGCHWVGQGDRGGGLDEITSCSASGMSHCLRRRHICRGWLCLHQHPSTPASPPLDMVPNTVVPRCGDPPPPLPLPPRHGTKHSSITLRRPIPWWYQAITVLHPAHLMTGLNIDCHPLVGILPAGTWRPTMV